MENSIISRYAHKEKLENTPCITTLEEKDLIIIKIQADDTENFLLFYLLNLPLLFLRAFQKIKIFILKSFTV